MQSIRGSGAELGMQQRVVQHHINPYGVRMGCHSAVIAARLPDIQLFHGSNKLIMLHFTPSIRCIGTITVA